MHTKVIDESHLATFKSKSEANIHRIANIAKIKLSLLSHYLDYRDWVAEQIEKIHEVYDRTKEIPMTNYKSYFHSSFEEWLIHTRVKNGRATTSHSKKIAMYSESLGYVDKEIADSMGSTLE